MNLSIEEAHETLGLDKIIKGKKMPIGTISRGRKKVAEGKWVPVKQKQTEQKMTSEEADSLLSDLRDNDNFEHDVMGKWEDHYNDKVDDENYTEDDAYDDAIDKVIELIKKDPDYYKNKYLK